MHSKVPGSCTAWVCQSSGPFRLDVAQGREAGRNNAILVDGDSYFLELACYLVLNGSRKRGAELVTTIKP